MRPVLTPLDGTAIIGGAELEPVILNSAYTTLTPTADWTQGGATYGDFRVKRIGNVCFLDGTIICNKVGGPHANLVVGTGILSVGFRPTIRTLRVKANLTAVNAQFSIYPNGDIIADVVANTSIINWGDTFEASP